MDERDRASRFVWGPGDLRIIKPGRPQDTISEQVTSDSLQERVDRELKLLWRRRIPRDYRTKMLCREDCLKAAIYHHLRRRLGDEYLIENRLCVWTEFGLGNRKRADLAVVRLKPNSGFDVESVLAIVECKSKAAWVDIEYFKDDVKKIRALSRLAAFRHTQFYLASIWNSSHQAELKRSNEKGVRDSWLCRGSVENPGLLGDPPADFNELEESAIAH